VKVYRIVPLAVWKAKMDPLPLAEIDKSDGYIHLSTKQQVLTTANLYFAPETRPAVLCFEESIFGANLRWEAVASRDGELFPHLYERRLSRIDVHAVQVLCHDGSGYSWPQE